MGHYPRILLTAPSSGSGKTWITCGILEALCERGMKVASFKCGPDYIDPMFHTKVIGTTSKNLDTFFTDEELTKYLFCRTAKQAEISVMEGVMGYYDGLAGISTKGSAYDLAKITRTNALLIVNCKGMSLSILPIIKGFLEYKEKSRIKGVILNQLPKSLYPELKEKIEQELPVKVYGYVPKMEQYKIESRHLGLVLPDEIKELKENLKEVASVLEESLDIDGIIALANQADELNYQEPNVPKIKSKLKIGVSKDEAFCFLYEDNLELLKQMGASVEYFSPLHDKILPNDLDGLLLCGGYPELYAKKLSENVSMRESVKNAIEKGIPYMAECGGFMYLHKTMEDKEGHAYDMVGSIDADCYKTSRLGRFGYIELDSKENEIFGARLNGIKGHEFHYYDSTSNGNTCIARKPLRKRTWECIHGDNKKMAGFPHLYYYSDFTVPYHFLQACESYMENKRHEKEKKMRWNYQ